MVGAFSHTSAPGVKPVGQKDRQERAPSCKKFGSIHTSQLLTLPSPAQVAVAASHLPPQVWAKDVTTSESSRRALAIFKIFYFENS